jgi:hypothetical protein
VPLKLDPVAAQNGDGQRARGGEVLAQQGRPSRSNCSSCRARIRSRDAPSGSPTRHRINSRACRSPTGGRRPSSGGVHCLLCTRGGTRL